MPYDVRRDLGAGKTCVGGVINRERRQIQASVNPPVHFSLIESQPVLGCRPPVLVYDGVVTSTDLHPDQAQKLMATVGGQLHFLNRLCDRMTELGFPV